MLGLCGAPVKPLVGGGGTPPNAAGDSALSAGAGRPRLGIPLPVPPLVLGIGAVLAGLIFGPGTLQTKLDILGFGICHQLLSHSFIIGGHPLPVCARAAPGSTWGPG